MHAVFSTQFAKCHDHFLQLIGLRLVLRIINGHVLPAAQAQRVVAGLGFGLRFRAWHAHDLKASHPAPAPSRRRSFRVAFFEHQLDVELRPRIVHPLQSRRQNRQHRPAPCTWAPGSNTTADRAQPAPPLPAHPPQGQCAPRNSSSTALCGTQTTQIRRDLARLQHDRGFHRQEDHTGAESQGNATIPCF